MAILAMVLVGAIGFELEAIRGVSVAGASCRNPEQPTAKDLSIQVFKGNGRVDHEVKTLNPFYPLCFPHLRPSKKPKNWQVLVTNW